MKKIGIEVEPPEEECEDENCPFHGDLRVRGRTFEGEVVSIKSEKTAIIERSYTQKVPKYERFERRGSKIPAHSTPCIEVEEGDRVIIGECKPVSKTKSFVIVKNCEEK